MKRKRGFTLVELLVVIGIIAVLISVLLPALNAARKQAATVKCLSALRQIGLAFQFYSQAYRDAYPVVRQDLPDNGVTPVNSINKYYTDMLMPFVTKGGKMNFEIGSDKLAFEQARASVLWGCPEWDGWRNTTATTVNEVSVFETGYAMNYYPTITADHPTNPAAMPPSTETQMRWASTYHGKYYKKTQWTKPSERLLMADANLWLLGFVPVGTPGSALAPQNAARALASTGGASNIDRYRHGKYPRIVGSGSAAIFSLNGGKVSFNVLYCDGHAATLSDLREGYKAIRMRYP